MLKIHENPEVLQSLVRGRQLSTSARRTCHLPVSWALGEFSVANTGPAVDSLSKHLWMVLLMGKFILSSYSLIIHHLCSPQWSQGLWESSTVQSPEVDWFWDFLERSRRAATFPSERFILGPSPPCPSLRFHISFLEADEANKNVLTMHYFYWCIMWS